MYPVSIVARGQCQATSGQGNMGILQKGKRTCTSATVESRTRVPKLAGCRETSWSHISLSTAAQDPRMRVAIRACSQLPSTVCISIASPVNNVQCTLDKPNSAKSKSLIELKFVLSFSSKPSLISRILTTSNRYTGDKVLRVIEGRLYHILRFNDQLIQPAASSNPPSAYTHRL